MVSLEHNSSYRQKLTHNPLVNAFVEFIENREITSFDFSQLEKVIYDLMVSYAANDKTTFKNNYTELSRREPSASAPYSYNDFLIFVLICGTKKFSLHQDWINSVLEIRSCSDDECKLSTLTLQNLLNENYSSTNNHFPIILTAQNLLDIHLLENKLLNSCYSDITQNAFPRFNSDFLNLVTLRAFDLIILRKDILDEGEVRDLKTFEKSYQTKVSQVSSFLHWIIIGGVYFLLLYSYFTNPSFQKFVKPHLTFFNSIGGGGLLVLLIFNKKIKLITVNLINKFWGYKNNV